MFVLMPRHVIKTMKKPCLLVFIEQSTLPALTKEEEKHDCVKKTKEKNYWKNLRKIRGLLFAIAFTDGGCEMFRFTLPLFL